MNKYLLVNKNKKIVIGYLIGTPAIMFVLFLLMKLPPIYSILAAVILGCIVNVFGYYRMKSRLKKVISDTKGLLGDHTIKLTEEGIYEKTRVSDNFYAWDVVTSIEENSHYIFIFMDNLLCHVIPKRDLTSTSEAQECMNQARAYKQKFHITSV